MQITLNRLNNSARQLNNDFNTFGNENLAALGRQRANMKNMNTTMQGLDVLLRTQIDNQGIAITNSTNEAQAMLNAINNLNGNQLRRGRSAPGRRSSGVTDVASP